MQKVREVLWAGEMLVSLNLQSNLSIPVYKTMLNIINKHHQEIKKVNAKFANTRAIHATLIQVIADQFIISQPLKKQLKTRAIQRSLSQRKKLKAISGKQTGDWPKAEKGEDRSSNRTRQNNKRADRTMESEMTAPRFQSGGSHLKRLASLLAKRTDEYKYTGGF